MFVLSSMSSSTYILIGVLSVTVSCFLMILLINDDIIDKWSWISDTKYNPSGNSNFSFRVGADIWNIVFYDVFIFFR